mmetsp:Transcript_8862/g.16433  ORF Transcript_8862/g.16433 Transcript_8862/m.16433 type:complete len:332 (+) Transcript_8862:227-1222(+)
MTPLVILSLTTFAGPWVKEMLILHLLELPLIRQRRNMFRLCLASREIFSVCSNHYYPSLISFHLLVVKLCGICQSWACIVSNKKVVHLRKCFNALFLICDISEQILSWGQPTSHPRFVEEAFVHQLHWWIFAALIKYDSPDVSVENHHANELLVPFNHRLHCILDLAFRTKCPLQHTRDRDVRDQLRNGTLQNLIHEMNAVVFLGHSIHLIHKAAHGLSHLIDKPCGRTIVALEIDRGHRRSKRDSMNLQTALACHSLPVRVLLLALSLQVKVSHLCNASAERMASQHHIFNAALCNFFLNFFLVQGHVILNQGKNSSLCSHEWSGVLPCP